MLRRKIRLYCIIAVLMHCGIGAVYAMYASFLIHRGLDVLQMCLVLSVYYALLAPLECPTGALADVYGRKTAVVLSNVFLILSMAVFAFTSDMAGFMGAVALKAIGRTYANGALDAHLADELDHTPSRLTRSVFQQTEVHKTRWSLGAALVGAVLSDIHMMLPWFMSIAFFGAALVITAVWMREERIKRSRLSFREGGEILLTTIRTGIRHGRSKNVRFIIFIAAGFWFAVMAPNALWQPYFLQWLPYQSLLGMLWVGASSAHLVGIWLTAKLKLRGRNALVVSCVIVGLGIMMTGGFALDSPILIFIAYLMHQAARGPFDPEKKAYLYSSVRQPEVRATVASFVSMVHHILAAIGLIITGLLAKYASMEWAFIVSGVALLIVVALLMNGEEDDKEVLPARADRRRSAHLDVERSGQEAASIS